MSWEKEKDRFCQIMKLSSYQYFFQAKKIAQSILRQQPYLPQSFVSAIQKDFSAIKNLLIMLYIYSHDIKLTFGWYSDRYVTKFKEVGQDHYSQLIQWVQNQQKIEEQLVIQFIIEQLPKFFLNKMNGHITPMDLQFLLYIFNNMDIKSSRSAKISLNFISKLQQFKFKDLGRDDSKENLLIKTVFNILANSKKGKGNMSIILDQYLLGHQEDKPIQKFCLMEGSFISSFQITVLLKIFKELFQKGINVYLICLINKISYLFSQDLEFFKLKRIYVQFILPILVKGKYCLKERVEQYVLKLCEFYIIGFSEHCRLGITGAFYLLYGIENVTSEKYRRTWARICFFAMKYQQNELKAVEKSLKAKGFEEEFIRQCKQINMGVDRSVWQITTRNIREHKVYKRFPSKLKGINNKRVQCYIISVVQALFLTKKLFPLLSKSKQNSQCVNSLASVFRRLQKGQDNIKVNDLQQNGPQFAKNQHQQDAQQYLLSLLNELEQNFKKTNLLQELKRSFQFSSRIVVKCNECNYESSSNQTGYIFTICYKDPIKFSSSEVLNDFTCSYCKKRNSTRLTTLSVNCQIFIFHINRFSNKWGEMKKQLPTQKIVRKFQNYELVGMIFHIGRSVESGHYVYYSRRQKKRWAELNDDRTSEFNIDDQCQEFQRQFKAEVTPYILFYQKI